MLSVSTHVKKGKESNLRFYISNRDANIEAKVADCSFKYCTYTCIKYYSRLKDSLASNEGWKNFDLILSGLKVFV